MYNVAYINDKKLKLKTLSKKEIIILFIKTLFNKKIKINSVEYLEFYD